MDIIKKKKYIPSSFLVIIVLMIFFIVASWVGQAFTNEITGIGILDIFTAIWRGFKSKIDIIIFIFSIGGTLGIMAKLKAVDAGISALANKLGDKVWVLIPILMIIFGLGGTTFGMWEETIAFIPILIPIFKKAGYGSFTAIMVILIGSGVGCLASTINPFTIGITISEITPVFKDGVLKSGIDGHDVSLGHFQGVRWLSFIIFEIIAILLVSWLATRYKKGIINNFTTDKEAIKNNDKKSSKFISFFTRARVVEGLDNKLIEERFKEKEKLEFTLKRKISLTLFVLSFILMITMYLPWSYFLGWGNTVPDSVKAYDNSMWWFASTSKAGFAKIWDGEFGWYFISVAAIFLMSTIIIFAINFREFSSKNNNPEEGFISTYFNGAKDMINVSMLIAVAAGLGKILIATGYGKLIAEKSAEGLTNWISFGIVVFLASVLLSLLVPSTSGFATAFMSIFSSIAVKAFPDRANTAIGIAILCFIFANGLANFITPTSAALMGYTSYAGVPYNVWLKQMWKVIFVFFVLALFIIIIVSAIVANGSNLF